MGNTLLLSGSVNPASSVADTTTYWSCIGYLDKTTTRAEKEMPIYENGTLSKLSIKIITSNVSGIVTFTLMKNGVDTGLTVATASANQTGTFEDLVHSVPITAGDKIVLKAVPAAGSTGTHNLAYVQMLFVPENAGTKTYSLFGMAHGSVRTLTSTSTTTFYPLTCYMDTPQTTEGNCQVEMRASASFKKLAINVTANTRSSPTIIMFRKNGADTALTISVNGGDVGLKTDLSNSVSVVANDLVDVAFTTGTGTGNFSFSFVVIEMEDSTTPNGLCMIMTANIILGTQSRNASVYAGVSGYFDLLSTEGAPQMKIVVAGFTAKFVGCRISGNTISTASNVYLRVNTADSAVVAPITAATAGFYEDTTHSVTLAAADLIAFRFQKGTGSGSQNITIKNISLYLESVNVAPPVNATEVSSANIANRFITKV